MKSRPIIITGASSGIGAATARACAAEGMKLVINARREEPLLAIADDLRALGADVIVEPGDVSDAGTSDRLLDACESAFGRIDIVFANAGYGIEKPTLELTEQELRTIFEVNFFASLDLISKAADRLIRNDLAGHLLMCSSCLAKFTMPQYAAYSATKAAQNHFCRAMNMELSPHRIPVSTVLPITTTTEFHRNAVRLSGKDSGEVTPDHAPKMFVQAPERVARAVVKCLKNPKPEVWTSFIVRATAAFGVLFPRFMDRTVRNR